MLLGKQCTNVQGIKNISLYYFQTQPIHVTGFLYNSLFRLKPKDFFFVQVIEDTLSDLNKFQLTSTGKTMKCNEIIFYLLLKDKICRSIINLLYISIRDHTCIILFLIYNCII